VFTSVAQRSLIAAVGGRAGLPARSAAARMRLDRSIATTHARFGPHDHMPEVLLVRVL